MNNTYNVMQCYLVLQSTYEQFQCALMSGSELIGEKSEHKHTASKNFTYLIEELLNTHHQGLQDISFIVVNRGPAPFSSLRVVLAAAQGISLATRIPLIGVDGLETFISEYANNSAGLTITLLNAWGNDVYFGIKHPQGIFETGCTPFSSLVTRLSEEYPTELLTFIGEGSLLYQDELKKIFGPRFILPPECPTYVSVQAIALAGYAQWQQEKTGSLTIQPLYLKNTF